MEPTTEAANKVVEAIMRGLQSSGVSLSAAVFPNVAGAIINFLFAEDTRPDVTTYIAERDAEDKEARSAAAKGGK